MKKGEIRDEIKDLVEEGDFNSIGSILNEIEYKFSEIEDLAASGRESDLEEIINIAYEYQIKLY